MDLFNFGTHVADGESDVVNEFVDLGLSPVTGAMKIFEQTVEFDHQVREPLVVMGAYLLDSTAVGRFRLLHDVRINVFVLGEFVIAMDDRSETLDLGADGLFALDETAGGLVAFLFFAGLQDGVA